MYVEQSKTRRDAVHRDIACLACLLQRGKREEERRKEKREGPDLDLYFSFELRAMRRFPNLSKKSPLCRKRYSTKLINAYVRKVVGPSDAG